MWHQIVQDMFVGPMPPLLEKMLRPLAVYAFLVIGLRLAGKRELAQLNPFDLVVLLTLANTVQNAIIGDDNTVTGGLVGAATLLTANYLLVRFMHRHRQIERLVEGDRDWLIRQGKVQRRHLMREMMTREELAAAAHRQGISSLAEVDSCVLEPNGTITFVTKTPSAEEIRHHEILDALEHFRQELLQNKAKPDAKAS